MKNKRWIKLYFIVPAIIISMIFIINFVVDPYSMTVYNILKIPNKFARDDRVEKVSKLKTSPKYDNIILGSSRVYSSNPLMVTKYLGGTTYNAGVGTARVEDHLGFILLLAKLDKLPKNLIIGLDFYSFNSELETNKYFLKNKDLNFLNKRLSNESYISNFLSIDALRASYKTLKNFLKSKKSKPRFDENGASQNASKIFAYQPDEAFSKAPFSEAQIDEEMKFIKTISYSSISKKRVSYLKQIIKICAKHDINLYLFLTPLHGQLISKIENDKELYKKLRSLKNIIKSQTPYYDFIQHSQINDNPIYFNNLTHTTPIGGNLIYAKIFNDKNISFAKDFGIFVEQDN
ncbi:MAG: hypothetical protein DRG78_11765 [Epsilonproteobacteria bacterium]|nr:MAG: hypothetical protein DRG78_11765 [Campylobacterota bacterium]